MRKKQKPSKQKLYSLFSSSPPAGGSRSLLILSSKPKGSRQARTINPFVITIKLFSSITLWLLPVFLAGMLFFFGFINLYLEGAVSKLSMLPAVKVTSGSYPVSHFTADKTAGHIPEISAQAALVMEDASKVVLFAKNENLQFSTASTAKIMTALTALDYYKPYDVLTVYTEGVEGAKVGFRKGERLSFEDMLYGMLLPSGNDAALAISENYPGGKAAFVEKMNKKANTLALSHTHFSDPAGLHDDGNYTTALDLARLSSVAMKHETFAHIVGTKRKTLFVLDGSKTHTVSNLNKLLGFSGVDGVKTGFTDEAGEVLVTSQVIDGHRFITVVMKSKDRFQDTQNLLSSVVSNTKFLQLEPRQRGSERVQVVRH